MYPIRVFDSVVRCAHVFRKMLIIQNYWDKDVKLGIGKPMFFFMLNLYGDASLLIFHLFCK